MLASVVIKDTERCLKKGIQGVLFGWHSTSQYQLQEILRAEIGSWNDMAKHLESAKRDYLNGETNP